MEEYKWEPEAKDTLYFGKNVPEEDRVPNEELTQIENNYKYLKVIARKFDSKQEWIDQINDMLAYTVIKYPQIIQALLFFTGSKNTKICYPNTNKMEWKTVRQFNNEWFSRSMLHY